MFNPGECPECGSINTDTVDTITMVDVIELVKVCHDCPTQYVVGYGDPMIKDVEQYD